MHTYNSTSCRGKLTNEKLVINTDLVSKLEAKLTIEYTDKQLNLKISFQAYIELKQKQQLN